MSMRERAQVERERGQARQRLIKLAEARATAETRYQEATDAIAAAWRANQARTDDQRHTNISAVFAATGIARSTLLKWSGADHSGDEPTRPDGDYTLDDLAELARARKRAKNAFDARSDKMAAEWRAIQNNPRTRLEVQPVERLTGVVRSTLLAWLSGSYRPSGPQIARRRAATEALTPTSKTTRRGSKKSG